MKGDAERYRETLEEWRNAPKPLAPFHWELEFPEVIERENPGFDAIVGNPPFAGKTTAGQANIAGYLDWLKCQHEESHGNADLVAHFFRRAFDLLRTDGVLGLIATNTIAQGESRGTGLRWICGHGGDIFHARKRVKWPGSAAVIASVVHVFKGKYRGQRLLEMTPVPKITAFLFHRGGDEDPRSLSRNVGKSFSGVQLMGSGFIFEEGASHPCSSLTEMRRIVEADPRNAELIFPYIGGAELNESSTCAPIRFVINFGDMTEAEARRWPDLMAVVERNVRPERLTNAREAYRRYWWQYGEKRVALWKAIADLKQVIAIASVSDTFAFVLMPSSIVFNKKIIVIASESTGVFGVLQSRLHEVWTRFTSSTFKDDINYNPSLSFETFPFPRDIDRRSALVAGGRGYHDCRAALMARNNEGLTRTYNRFHDPDECDPDILKLRALHAEMDRAVLDAYDWNDISTDCEFLLDYSIDEEEWGDRTKPYRYRWPDDVRDEVLARLLELNAERAREEARSGAAAEKKRDGKRARKPVQATASQDLFS